MQTSEIVSDSLQAVRDLKSKFEQLSRATPSSPNQRPAVYGESLSVTAPTSPRPRASSNTFLETPTSDASHLRASSSSSDLRVPAKRAPPPPPPRASRQPGPSPTPSPAQSPLLRPVPIPTTPEAKESNLVSSLKNRFAATTPPPAPKLQSPRPSISAILTDSKPTLPPRPTSILGPPRTVTSPDAASDASSRSSSQDESRNAEASPSKFLPPPIPARRQNEKDVTVRDIGAHFSDSSQNSLDSDAPLPSVQRLPPPRPPTRSRISPNAVDTITASSSVPTNPQALASPPPPLPARRSTILTHDSPVHASSPPNLPSRPQPGPNGVDRRPLGASKLPPPPTRVIGLGDRLPPPRRPASPSSDEESGDEDEPRALMPDTSTSSRRPPTLGFRDGFSEPRIPIHPHSGCFALSGSRVVVGHSHHIKIYDLAMSEVPVFNLDTKDLGPKETKVTCMEVRPTVSIQDMGFLVWIGTKDGHLLEMDIRTGTLRGTKYAAHLHPITHLFRQGRSMVSLDESGKALVFSPDAGNEEDINLLVTIPRVIRTTDKQDFVKMIDGKLWTAARSEHHGGLAQRLPIIRVYDIFNPASTGRSLLPTEHVGPVTSATIIPSQPDVVYVGHEEGYISIWELHTEDGYPRCIEVMKVSMSDVLSLEGVNSRLWAGGRNGMISAYDTTQKPWLVTNCWNAHPGLPVLKLVVNHFAIVKAGRLCVASIGRDEQLRLWDGLLGLDWVDKELLKVETSFSSFRDLTLLVFSWNCDSARPDSLTGETVNFNLLNDAIHSVDKPPDIIVFGFQEVIDLESRKMAAKNVLLGGKKKADDGLSEKVTGAYKRWYDRLVLAVKAAMPKDLGYCVVHTENLVGLFTCIFVKSSERAAFDDVAVTTVKRGMGGRYGNKGAIVARFVVGDSSICFINCHLAAGQNGVRRRNADVAGILEEKAVFAPTEHSLAYVGGGDGSMILDHEFVILSGDMNYRFDHRRDAIMAAIRAGDLTSLLQHDQLLREIKYNRGCRLRGFSEGLLTFDPTYKYDPRSNDYDTSEKRRSPAWCDRILWQSRVPTRVRQLGYRRYEANVSDHRPISAAFAVRVKAFDSEAREKAKGVLQAEWVDEQERLLVLASEFYRRQEII